MAAAAAAAAFGPWKVAYEDALRIPLGLREAAVTFSNQPTKKETVKTVCHPGSRQSSFVRSSL